MSDARPAATTRRRWRWLVPAAVLVTIWLLSGWRAVPDDRFGVLEGLGSTRRVDGGWAIAPPGLLRLSTYPRGGVEVPLPQAERAMLPAADGSRFGFRGWITLRPRIENWRALHRAAGGGGVEGALVDAVRQAAEGLADRGRPVMTTSRLRDFEQRLTDALLERGLDLRRLELDSIDFLAVDASGGLTASSDARVLVVGLDGADWEILDSLLEQGKLPHLRRLIDDGARAKLLSISPLLSPVIWTTVATGVEPSRHGILDFLVAEASGEQRQPVTSAQRRVPTAWEMLSRSGVEVGVVGWWATWPADPVRGYLVSDRLAYQLFGYRADPGDARGKTWPPDLYDEILPLIVEPDSVGWDRVEPYLGGERIDPDQFDEEERKLLDEFRTLLASGETYLAIAEALSRRFDPRLEVVYFEGTDTIGHLFMPYRPPLFPGVDAARSESFGPMVDRYYETADRFLGRLLEGRDENWTVMVLSDHGFASDATRPRSTDSRIGHGAAADWHRRFGALILSGAHIRPGTEIGEASVYDIAPTLLALFGLPIPSSWPGHVLGQAIDPVFLEANPVRYRHDDPERGDPSVLAGVDPAAADLLEKLQSLGYVSAAGGADSLSARNNTAVALIAEGRYAEAEQELRAGLEEHPDSPMLLVNLGMALQFQGDGEEAAELFERGMTNPDTLRLAGHQLARLRMDDGDLDGAETLLRRVLEREPDAAEVHNSLGLVLERRGDLVAAEGEYARAAELDPDGALARNNLGTLAKRRGAHDEAEQWYLRAIEADPYFMGAYNNLALVYQARGEMQKAIDLYNLALTKSPDNAVVQNNLASLYYATGELDRARELWQRSVVADPGYPSPLNNLAGMEINAQRFDDAERLLQRALDLDPAYGDARINLAIVLRARGELDEAREQLQRATEDPRSGGNSWKQLGLFELQTGRPEQAADALARARELLPRDTETLNALGESFFRAGKQREAFDVWQLSLQVDPRQPRLREILQGEP